MASYAYDYLGRRISRTIYGSPDLTIKYAYDGDRIIAEYDANDVLLRKCVYGPGIDEPICLIDVADSNAVYYYHFDGLGSVVALSDVNNVPVERYAYDVFGRPTIRDANGVVIQQSALGNPYLFTGRAWDPETALYDYRARYYDYFTGRFLQPDPTGYGDGLNLYAYVGNNPLNWVDPYGLCKQNNLYLLSGGSWRGAIQEIEDAIGQRFNRFLENHPRAKRAWEGRYVGTQYGESSLRWYAQRYVAEGSWSWQNWRRKLAYATAGLLSAAWTKNTWKKTTAALAMAYGLRNAGRPWTLQDGTPGYTPVDYGKAFRVERHMLGKGGTATRGLYWHIDALWGIVKHWPWRI